MSEKSEKIYGQFDLDTIEKLAEIVKSKDLGEITIKNENCEITVKGKKCPPPMPVPMNIPAAVPVANAAVNQAATTETQSEKVSGKEVKSPIVGTFYAAPSPDSKPFVSVGDKVKKGDTIFIIESMKVMSEIQSEFDGVVKEILVESGEPVEFGQTLMIIG